VNAPDPGVFIKAGAVAANRPHKARVGHEPDGFLEGDQVVALKDAGKVGGGIHIEKTPRLGIEAERQRKARQQRVQLIFGEPIGVVRRRRHLPQERFVAGVALERPAVGPQRVAALEQLVEHLAEPGPRRRVAGRLGQQPTISRFRPRQIALALQRLGLFDRRGWRRRFHHGSVPGDLVGHSTVLARECARKTRSGPNH